VERVGADIRWRPGPPRATLTGVTSTIDTTIERVDPSDGTAMRAIYDVWSAAYLELDPDNPLPTFPEIVARATAPHRSVVEEFWSLRDGDEVVGSLWLEMPTRDNLELAEVELAVHPRSQGRGHGRRLLAHLVARAAELGRHQLITGLGEPPDGDESRSTRFAAAAGARRSLGVIRRTLDHTRVDRARLSALRAEAARHAAGYQVVGWTGPCPDDLVDDYAALVGRMSTDAPMGDLDIEPEHWDAARIRERESVMTRQGRTEVATAARLGDDGPLVAYTDIVTTRHDPVNAFQWDTLVRREDRGHRLGTLVKAANLERLLDTAPEARRVHTWNADTNSYMVAINELLGFRIARLESAWRLDVAHPSGKTDLA
jgi:GNAT superfamily N-acetyltransferase